MKTTKLSPNAFLYVNVRNVFSRRWVFEGEQAEMYACMMVGPSFTSLPNEREKKNKLHVNADDDGAAACRHASNKADVLSLHSLDMS